jgi:hypothetical protein
MAEHRDDDLDRLRRDDDDAQGEASRRVDDPDQGGFTIPCVVTTGEGTFPTTAQAWYWVQPYLLTGTPVEGGSVTETAAGDPFLAANLGSGIPTADSSRVLVHWSPYAHWFRFDG